MERFISKDRKTISLPVALGTELYRVNTSCGDFCTFQSENFQKIIDNKNKCSGKLPCHTVALEPQKITLTIDNISILKEWQEKVFLTKEEAKEKTKEIVERNIKFLQDNKIVVYGNYGTKRMQR